MVKGKHQSIMPLERRAICFGSLDPVENINMKVIAQRQHIWGTRRQGKTIRFKSSYQRNIKSQI